MSASTAVSLKGVLKEYQRADYSVRALDQITLDIPSGQFFCLMGPSGSGKSTLLHLVAGIDRPTDGTVEVLGSAIGEMDDRSLARWRSQNIGYIFQSFNLVPVMDCGRENVELPLLLTHLSKKEAPRARAQRAGDRWPRGSDGPSPRSNCPGGQEQRVAIARAIVTDPSIILADEPTGELDAQSATDVLTILETLNANHAKTIIMVTHDPRARQYAKESRYLDKGKMTEMPEIQ